MTKATMVRILGSGALFLVLCGQPVLGAQVEARFTIATNFYRVTGSNVQEILASIRQARPWGTNHAFHATTDWRVRWSYHSISENGRVRLTQVELTTRVAVALPQWVSSGTPPAELAGRWQRYYRALTLHEEGHLRLAREATSQLRRQLSALGSFGSKQELENELDRVTTEVLTKVRQREREYDRQTGHGATQGAAFW